MNPFYLVMIGVCIISSLTMFLHMEDYSTLSTKSRHYFTLLFFGIIIVAAAEALGDWMNIGGVYRTAHVIVKFIEFSIMPCLPVFMSLACNVKRHSQSIFILLCAHAVLELLGLPFHLIFYVDSMGFYHRGPFYFIYLVISAASLLFVLAAFYKLSDERVTKRTATLWMIAVVMFSALIPSVISGKCHSSILGITLCAILLYEYYQSLIQRDLLENLKKEKESIRCLLEQTVTALVYAIEAKDKYTYGHSARVAKYSRKIAKMNGKSEEECDEIFFFSALA